MKKRILRYGIVPVFFLIIANSALAQQSFYVNDNSSTGDVYTSAAGNNSNPGTASLPFGTINHAISQAQAGDIIWVDAGTYIENVFVDKSITFKGAKAGNNPGASLDRNNETIVRPASNDIQNGLVFNVRATNITIDGFLIDGDNPAISGGASINGVDINAGMGVFNQQLFVDGLTVKNNIFKNFNRFGVFLRRLNQSTVTENNLVTNNRFDNINITAGVGMFNNAYATVTNNYFTRTGNGIYFGQGSIASNLEILIANNYIEASGTNIVFAAMAASSLDVSIINNTLNPVGSTVGGEGIGIGNLTTTGSLRVINNVISNKQNGIDISSITAPGGVYINGGGVLNSTGVGLFLTAENTTFSISNLTLQNNDVGIDASGIGSAFRLSFSNVFINGGTTGIRFYGTGLTLPGNALTGVSFSGQTKDYILQTANSFNGQTIDASTVLFEGTAPTSMTLAQLFATEDKLTHRIDFNNVGYFKLKPNEVFVTPNSFAPTLHPSFGVATTAPDINRAISAAAEGNIVHIAAGTYTGQVLINKGITLQGEGVGATIINPGNVAPATLGGLPPGVIYSASGIGDVFIKDVTINSGVPQETGIQFYGISLQTGGGISGCEINGAAPGLNTGQGIFIQKDDVDPEAISILNNHLHHINVLSIKINVPHIVATVNNNTIDVTNSGFGMGLVAGGEPHLIDGLDFIGNKIKGITGFGAKVNCSNSNVTISNNSFEKGANEFFTAPFIQNNGSYYINASCNWFGSADAEIVRSRIQGFNVSYAPWLSNGTDNNIAFGFQPVEGVCNGRQNKFYVNDNSQAGDALTTAIGNNSNNGFSTAPFATINYALSQAQAGDTIYVDAGLYVEDVVVNKSIIIKGVQAGINPGTSLSRGAESIIVPATDDPVNGTVINILVRDVVFDGFTIDGNNPSISGSVILNGVDINKGHGIASFIDNSVAHNNLVIKNNIVRNVQRYGVFMQSTNALPLSGNLITQNHFDNISVTSGRQGRAVGLANNGYATVSQNVFTKVHTAIWISGGFNAPSQTGCSITGNIIESYLIGIIVGGFSGAASPYLINNNSVTVADLASWNVPGASIENFNSGIFINNVTSAGGMNISNNTITNTYEGLAFGRLSGSSNWVVNGNTISGSKEIGLYYFNNSATNPPILLEDNILVDNDTAIYIHYLGGGTMPVAFSNNSVTGGNIGLGLDGSQISLPGNVLTGVSFTGLSGNYIQLIRNALNGQTIDASTLSFENKIAADMSLPELFAVENKLAHRIDYNGVGFVKIKPNHVFVTTSSFNSTLTMGWGTATISADINRAVAAASEGDIINIAAGTYVNQVTVDKGITLIGEGKDATLLVPPALPYLPPPGPFTETGLIQTTQNIGDVHIRDLSATGDHLNGLQGILIQSGGSVRNCKIQNGNQGIFFRVESAVKTAVAENNIIAAEYIATNFQGSGLTASLINNSITVSNPGFSSGVFAGLDFGPLPQFTATGNAISGFAHSGFFGGSSNTSITQNSIVGTGPAIWQMSGSTIQANCNWFGTADAQSLALKFSGNVNYNPWLSNGTDNSGDIGFQPIENVCGGRQNKFYVNDNNQTGDVLTTSVGSNSNNGFSTAPFATLEYAYSIAQAGDTIYVDAGTYNTPNILFNKAITIKGSNYQISPNNAADKRQPNAGRNAEAIIAGSTFTIGSNNISVRGLTLEPGNKSAFFLNSDFGNFFFGNNILRINTPSNIGQFNLTGISVTGPAMPQTSGYTITNNRFEKMDASTGTTLVFSYIKNISVTNNAFVVTGATPRTQVAAAFGNIGLTDSVVFSNNTIDKASTGVSGRIGYGLISDNKFYDSPTSCTFNNNVNVSSNIEVMGNYMETNSGGVPFIGYNRTNGGSPGSSSILKAENNTMIGVSSGASGQLFGSFNITVNNSVLNPTIILKGNKINYSGNLSMLESGSVRPITLRGKIANATIENNEISLSNSGGTLIPTAPGGALVHNPGITINTEFGSSSYLPSNAVINILNNKIDGFKQSVVVYDPTTGAGALNPFIGYGNLPAGAVVNIQNNSFTNDSISINNGNVGQSVIANCNWYGSAAAQAVAAKVSNGSVIYSTWLTNGTDSDIPTTGFQTMAGSCNGTPVTVALGSTNNVTCFGANNGSIAINISGGTPAYTIAWSKDGDPYSTNEDLINLEPGTYGVTVTDANGSIASITDIVISEPLLLTASASGTNVNCFGGSNGSALVIAEGGTAPYAYLWSNGATTDDISNLPAGNYTVTITDANGCTVSANYQVTEPTLLTAIATPTSTSCFNSILAAANGGTAPYTYLWSNGATTASISSIAAGTYSVVITDAKGCSVSASATVTANEAFNPSASSVNVSCFGGANGSITVTNVNAVAPFQYSIDGGLHYQPNATFNGLAAGTYTITVKDANGCTGFVTKTITQPTQLIVSLVSLQNTCYGQSSGAINVNVTGGTSGYAYSWTGPNGYNSTQKNISGLASGTYNFTVTDSRGCTANLTSLQITSTNQIFDNAVVTQIACKGETNGSISLSPTGGSGGGFTYLWNNGATTQAISNLGVGNYSVTITNTSTGCSINRSYTITQPSTNVNLSVSKTNATGCASLGSITATGSGGTAGYQYRLNTDAYQSSGLFTGLYAGSYTVWVKDLNGCTKSSVVSITDNGGDEYEGNNSKNLAKVINTNIDVFARIALTNDAADWFKFTPSVSGNYTLSLTHPSTSFTFNLYATGNNTPPLVPTTTTSTTKQYSLVANNTYYISITGGLSYECYTLNVAAPSFLTRSSSQEQPTKEKADELFDVKVLGNPSQNQFNIIINSSSDEKIRMRVVDVSGRVIDVKENLQAGQSVRIGEKYRSGAYFAEIRQGDKTKTVRLIKL